MYEYVPIIHVDNAKILFLLFATTRSIIIKLQQQLENPKDT